MAQIYNTGVLRELREGMNAQVNSIIPQQLAVQVTPVMEVNPKLLRRCNVLKAAIAAGTIWTTPSDKDFYLTYAQVAAKVGTAVTSLSCTATIEVITSENDSSLRLIGVSFKSTAVSDACWDNATGSFVPPILLKRGSIILGTDTNCAGREYTIAGYTVD